MINYVLSAIEILVLAAAMLIIFDSVKGEDIYLIWMLKSRR